MCVCVSVLCKDWLTRSDDWLMPSLWVRSSVIHVSVTAQLHARILCSLSTFGGLSRLTSPKVHFHFFNIHSAIHSFIVRLACCQTSGVTAWQWRYLTSFQIFGWLVLHCQTFRKYKKKREKTGTNCWAHTLPSLLGPMAGLPEEFTTAILCIDGF